MFVTKRNNDIGGKAQLLLHVLCFLGFFVGRAEVLLHLSSHWWRRGDLMKIGFIGITRLKRWGFTTQKRRE